jgi:bacteriorhodopsin
MNYLNLSAYGSLAVQLITGLIEAKGLTIPLTEENLIVQDILALELLVQSIEFIFYVYLVYLIVQGKLSSSVTSHRYLDWCITTPTMLVSFAIFFKYLNQPTRKIRLLESIREEQGTLLKLVLANTLMLGLGFLAERSFIPRYVGVAFGFLPFAYIFKVLYANYVKTSVVANRLFYFSFIIWGLYGVAAVLPFASKNIAYNILDVLAKNVYGIFLYFFILYNQKQ